MTTDTDYHAVASPSSAHMWIECAASLAMCKNEPESSSAYADEGTAAHSLAASCLKLECDANDFIGEEIDVKGRATYTVDQAMADAVQIYLNTVRDQVNQYEMAGYEVDMHVEVAVPIGHITTEIGATGTSDCILIALKDDSNVISIIDLKYGQGVEVSAKHNPQAKLYALGAIKKFEDVFLDTARMTISQPRINPVPNEWSETIEDLITWAADIATPAARTALHLRESAAAVYPASYFNPGEKQCKFCKANAKCPALKAHATATIRECFEDISGGVQALEIEDVTNPNMLGAINTTVLADVFLKIPLVELWIKAVAEKVNSLALAGESLPGIKVVRGRKGSRAWDEIETVETELKTMRVKHDEMYDYEVKSPTKLEKVMQDKYPRNWKKIATHITQSEGALTAAPETDKRPAVEVKPLIDQFESLE